MEWLLHTLFVGVVAWALWKGKHKDETHTWCRPPRRKEDET
jgi:hypothetical protein